MSTERAFLDALAADPSDDATRLVYADWLEVGGRQRQAAYLRLECSIAANWRREWKINGRLDAARQGLDWAWVNAAGRPYDVLLFRDFDPRPVRQFPREWVDRASAVLASMAGITRRRAREKVSGRSGVIATLPHGRACDLRDLLIFRPGGLVGNERDRWPKESNVSVRLAPPGVRADREGGGKSVGAMADGFMETLLRRPSHAEDDRPRIAEYAALLLDPSPEVARRAVAHIGDSAAERLVIDDLNRVRVTLGFGLILPNEPASPPQ